MSGEDWHAIEKVWEAGERGGPRLLGGEEAWGLSYFSAQFWGGLDMKGKIFTAEGSENKYYILQVSSVKPSW